MANKTELYSSIENMFLNKNCKAKMLAKRIIRADEKPLKISGNFSTVISNSIAPSNTIKIRPIVPKTGIRLSKKEKLS